MWIVRELSTNVDPVHQLDAMEIFLYSRITMEDHVQIIERPKKGWFIVFEGGDRKSVV